MQFDETLLTMIVIRADLGVRYGFLSKIIKACQNNHFQSFALKAMQPARPKRPG